MTNSRGSWRILSFVSIGQEQRTLYLSIVNRFFHDKIHDKNYTTRCDKAHKYVVKKISHKQKEKPRNALFQAYFTGFYHKQGTGIEPVTRAV